jgi:hypothetical protein
MIQGYEAMTVVDKALAQFLARLDRSTCVSCYLTGSYADEYYVPYISDLDLTLILRQSHLSETKNHLMAIAGLIGGETGVDFDVSFIGVSLDEAKNERQLLTTGIGFREAVLSAKIAGRFVWGEDLLQEMPLPNKAKYIEDTEKIPFEFSNRIRGYKGLTYPLDYPNAGDQFLGFLRRNEDGSLSTKPLISLYTWIGTATAAKNAGIFVGNKRQCISGLKQVDKIMGEELETVFRLCRNEWGYKVPSSKEGVDRLKNLCAQALVWENCYAQTFFPHLFPSRPCEPREFHNETFPPEASCR